jgi:hypothetical protein
LRRVVWQTFTDVLEVLPASLIWTGFIALMLKAVSTSETSVNFNQTTRRNNPEDSHIFYFFSSLNNIRMNTSMTIKKGGMYD